MEKLLLFYVGHLYNLLRIIYYVVVCIISDTSLVLSFMTGLDGRQLQVSLQKK